MKYTLISIILFLTSCYSNPEEVSKSLYSRFNQKYPDCIIDYEEISNPIDESAALSFEHIICGTDTITGKFYCMKYFKTPGQNGHYYNVSINTNRKSFSNRIKSN